MPSINRLPTGSLLGLAVFVAVLAVLFTRGGDLVSPGELNAHGRSATQRGGVSTHAELANNCAACHTPPWSSQTMADRCLECHTDIRDQLAAQLPMHGQLSEGLKCRSCHTEHRGADGVLTTLDRFDHNLAAFKLTGKHQALECAACHINRVFKGTSQACIACHAEPQVHKGRFGSDCAQCHSTATWTGAILAKLPNFDHNTTAFKLTGKHQSVDCKACHINNVFKGTSQSCVACHAEPLVHKGRFGADCAKCHSTATWTGVILTKLSNFDHNTTAFKLTGKHQAIDCKACHINNVFKGTAQSCVSCHAEPQVHKGRYGNDCARCHTTTVWTGATFKHTFPLTHGKRKAIECATCHTTAAANDFKTYTCYGCHEHEPTRIARKHQKIANLQNCVRCHPTGREKERRAGLDDGLRLEVLLDERTACVCPQQPAGWEALVPQLSDGRRVGRGSLRDLPPGQQQLASAPGFQPLDFFPSRTQAIDSVTFVDSLPGWYYPNLAGRRASVPSIFPAAIRSNLRHGD